MPNVLCKDMKYWTVVKRNGMIVPFNKDRITLALQAAFCDTFQTEVLSHELLDAIQKIETRVLDAIAESEEVITVERIQDLVELALMEAGHHEVAKDYIIYRQKHKTLREDSPEQLMVLRRDMKTWVRLQPLKIAHTIQKAFREVFHLEDILPTEMTESINAITHNVLAACAQEAQQGFTLDVERIGDIIELQLMKEECFAVAKHYIITRANLTKEEPIDDASSEEESGDCFTALKDNGVPTQISKHHLLKTIRFACKNLANVSADKVLLLTMNNIYDHIKESEVFVSSILAARSLIEQEPNYTFVAARLLLNKLYLETLHVDASCSRLNTLHKTYFKKYIEHGVAINRLHPQLLSFNLDKLAMALDLHRDQQFSLLGLQTLYDRYLIHEDQNRLETPQIFWMRIAMGLSLLEGVDKTERAISFYHVLSQFLFVSSTPTLFNAGTNHQQLSSCYLSTVMDDLAHIYKVISDDAMLSKWAGGIGNDWTNIRATGAAIKGTNGQSQGVIPFLKVANDTAVAVNQGGKRKGAICAYLETWHLDIEEFLELRKNTGDDRRRTHDMNTANWIPDLFMKRVLRGEPWTLFSPDEVPDLHDAYGKNFEKRYLHYEQKAERGEIRLFKKVDALTLWRKMLGMLFETGHPWLTFKDPCNIRSPQDHVGVVHSSNLCTEITLNSSYRETAVCNLGSINLAAHTTPEGLDTQKLEHTINTAVRMLDNVIDINFYPTPEAKQSNVLHRPIGLGIMGFQDALYIQNISYASQEAIDFADYSSELISYYTILASSYLAKERGPYSSFKGSKWHRGLLPLDTLLLLAEERGEEFIELDLSSTLDWTPVREAIKTYGMRNSNVLAIAPTATIANIVQVSPSIEPYYKHLFVKSNLSGEFTVINTHLVQALKQANLWDAQMLDDIKYFDGSIQEIERIPHSMKKLFLTAFEIDPSWIIECAARRQKWIDMAQSLNLYMAQPSGKQIHEMYVSGWKKGLKTFYYLRATGATHVEKSTTDINSRGLQPRWMKHASPSSRITIQRNTSCPLEGCESCQ